MSPIDIAYAQKAWFYLNTLATLIYCTQSQKTMVEKSPDLV